MMYNITPNNKINQMKNKITKAEGEAVGLHASYVHYKEEFDHNTPPNACK